MRDRDWNRDHDPDELDELLTARAPISINDIRLIDMVGCPECGVVLHLHGRDKLEERTAGSAELFSKAPTVKGVFCPVCDQMLFDQESWVDHLAERKVYDRDAREASEGKGRGAEQGAKAAA